MKNVTVSLDDETYRRGRLRAAEMDTTLSALVRDFINTLGARETERERLKREERALRSDPQNLTFSGADRLTRDELYDRARDRAETGEWRDAVNG